MRAERAKRVAREARVARAKRVARAARVATDHRVLLHVCECYVGGVRTHLDLLLPELRARGFRVVAALSTRRDADAALRAARLESSGIDVRRIELSRGPAPREDRAARRALCDVQRECGAAIVHSHGSKAGFVARTATFESPVARVHTPHGFAHAKRREFGLWKRVLFRAIERRLVARTDRLVAVSTEEASAARAIGHDASRIHLIRNAVRLPDRTQMRTRERARIELGLPQQGLHALIAGILMPEKGQELVLQALAESEARSWTAWFVGEGPDRSRLEALAAQLRLGDRARFAGQVPDLAPWIDACDLALLPSHSEGSPYVVLEVLARSRPLLASEVGGLREIWSAEDLAVAARSGVPLLLSSREPRIWAGALAAWGSNAEAREALGARGRERVTGELALEAQVNAHVALYEELLATSASRGGSTA